MADTRSETYELRIGNLFIDGDTRIITLKNPKSTITTEEITALEELITNGAASSSLLVGDKTGSDFRRINYVDRVKTVKTNLDLSSDDDD